MKPGNRTRTGNENAELYKELRHQVETQMLLPRCTLHLPGRSHPNKFVGERT